MTRRQMRNATFVLIAVAIAAIAAAFWVIVEERAVSTAQHRLLVQSRSLPAEIYDPLPVRRDLFDAAPPRADVLNALYLGRAAQGLTGADRDAQLVRAARLAEGAAQARPVWGEAWAVLAMIEGLRTDMRSERTRAVLSRSYRDLPYLRLAGTARVNLAFANWRDLETDVRERAINEAVWLSLLDIPTRETVFASARRSDAYVDFLLAWRRTRRATGQFWTERFTP